MGKQRIFVLAKELGIGSSELIEKLKAEGIEAATPSSSVDDAVADKLRAASGLAPAARPAAPAPPKGGLAAKAAAAKKLPPGKRQPEKAPLWMPATPPAPIPRLTKAVKPARPKEITADVSAGIEERRRIRQARMRGEIPVEAAAPEAPVAIEPEVVEVAPEPVVEEPQLVVMQVAEAAIGASAEPVAQVVELAPPPAPAPAPPSVAVPPPAPARWAGLPQRSADGTPARRVEEPRLAGAPAPPGAAASTVTSAPSHQQPPTLPSVVRPPAAPSQSAPPSLPLRGIREFRGPVRKIDLPPQPPRTAYGRTPSIPPSPSSVASTTQTPRAPGAPGAGQGLTRTFSQRPGTGLGKSKRKRKENAPAPVAPVVPIKKGEGATLRLTEGVTVKELADKMEVKGKDIIRILMNRGIMVTVNMALDPELAKSIATEFGYAPEVVSFEEDLQAQEEEQIVETEEIEGEEETRPPVVTVMGHVDHGKTSLLDAIRKTNVAAGEAGGITQSIGAYQVEIHGRRITFIDTPGHAAFTSMRARGAQVTDIVILVIAASDSVMPQTIEAINHAKAAGVPIIVAINKIDLPNARPDKVKTDLMSHGILLEEFGGEVVAIPVSARQGTNLEQLLEMVLLSADIRGLKANFKRRALGTVLEAGIDRGMGPFANVIVEDGTLKPGDNVIVGAEFGRVRALLDDRGTRLEEAGPSSPVQVTGLQGVPKAGDKFQVVESESRAREISEFRLHKRREAELAKSGARGTLQDISKAIAEGETKELPVVVKADVHGAVEVLSKTLTELSTDKVRLKIIHAGTGAITDSDVLLASASRAIVVGFNVRPERGAADLAEREKVVVRLHEIIYELTDEMKLLMAGLLDSVREEEFLGRAEVRQTFKVSRIGTVAGCIVQDGKITRSAEVRLVRDGAIVWTGRLATLKRFKDDAREVTAGLECGIGLQDFNDVKVGDTIEAFTIRETRPVGID